MFHYLRGNVLDQGRAGLFPGAFNPVTVAHLAIARAAREQYGLAQVAFVLPGEFPHKEYGAISFEDRVNLLDVAMGDEPGLAIASTGGGLFIEIAREFSTLAGDAADPYLLCGRDAAERSAQWDYREHGTLEEQLHEFQLLVAGREGDYEPPPEYAGRVHLIRLPDGCDQVSSSAVRAAIQGGSEWRHLVPPGVAARIQERDLYR